MLACAEDGNVEKTEAMIQNHGAAAVAAWRGKGGWTALLVAVTYCPSADVWRALIRAGVSATTGNNISVTPLHNARTAEAVRVLMAAGASCSALDMDGFTPLHVACHTGRVDAALAMIEACGSKPSVLFAENRDGAAPRHLFDRFGFRFVHKLSDYTKLLYAFDQAEAWSRRRTL